jgi:hypothetical protein
MESSFYIVKFESKFRELNVSKSHGPGRKRVHLNFWTGCSASAVRPVEHGLGFVRLTGGWWLVLIRYERKILVADWWLLAGAELV